MKMQDLIEEYQKISDFLNEKWPLKNQDHRIFARTMKVVEELGELSDEILTSMNLQRDSKIAKFSRQNVEDEFADVMSSLVLLGLELEINIEAVLKRKIEYTRSRFKMGQPLAELSSDDLS